MPSVEEAAGVRITVSVLFLFRLVGVYMAWSLFFLDARYRELWLMRVLKKKKVVVCAERRRLRHVCVWLW